MRNCMLKYVLKVSQKHKVVKAEGRGGGEISKKYMAPYLHRCSETVEPDALANTEPWGAGLTTVSAN